MSFSNQIRTALRGKKEYKIFGRTVSGYAYTECINDRQKMPVSGWKIHVSATVFNGARVLEKSLKVICRHRVSFKVSGNTRDLERLNTGHGGITQVGKFITIYPAGKKEFVQIIHDLSASLKGFAGPAIMSDKQFRGVVHYRFGSLENVRLQTSTGLEKNYIISPSGEFIEDDRTQFYIPPWEADPFPEIRSINIAEFLKAKGFIIHSVLQLNYKGSVLLVQKYTDKDLPLYILKKYNRAIFIENEKINVIKLAGKEKAVLNNLSGLGICPAFIDSFNDRQGNLYNLIEYIPGISLIELIQQQGGVARYLEFEEVSRIAVSVCKIFIILSNRHLIYRDLKPGNILITEKFRIYLIDFETSIGADENIRQQKFGTKGFRSPQQLRGAIPKVQDDIYAFGGILYYMLTNANPSLAPRETLIGERPPELLRDNIPQHLIAITNRCLEENEAKRYQSFRDILRAFQVKDFREAKYGSVFEPGKEKSSLFILKNLAGRVYDTLKREFYKYPSLGWVSSHNYNEGLNKNDLSVGLPGIAASVFLIAEKLKRNDRAFLSDITLLLEQKHRMTGNNALPGFFVGKSGLGFCFLLHSHLFNSKRSLANAIEIADEVWENLPQSFDLYNGLSGCGLYYLQLYAKTTKRIYLERAGKIVDHILSSYQLENDIINWPYPEHYDSLGGKIAPGLAHGIAGIGYFLCEYYHFSKDPEAKVVIMYIIDSLDKCKVAAKNDGSGVNWSDYLDEDSDPSSIYWCNGCAGIALFLAKAFSIVKDKATKRLLTTAVNTICTGSRYLNPTYCHGLAGNIDILITIQQFTKLKAVDKEVRRLAIILRSHLIIRDNEYVFPSEEPSIISPDFMVGYSGTAYALMRLCYPYDKSIFSASFFDNHKVKRIVPKDSHVITSGIINER